MAKILFVEDDRMIASGLIYALEQEGYGVTHCANLAAAQSVLGNPWDLALVDLSLPDGSGFDLGRALILNRVPVIYLTAVDDEANVVMGLEMGAEDYVTKPFRLRELLARMARALKKQDAGEAGATISLGPELQIHTLQAKVYRKGQEVELTALEYRLLLVFAGHPGQVLTRNQLLEGIWDVAGNYVNDNTLTVYIKRLREKLGDDSGQPRLIKTVRGMGYKIHV